MPVIQKQKVSDVSLDVTDEELIALTRLVDAEHVLKYHYLDGGLHLLDLPDNQWAINALKQLGRETQAVVDEVEGKCAP